MFFTSQVNKFQPHDPIPQNAIGSYRFTYHARASWRNRVSKEELKKGETNWIHDQLINAKFIGKSFGDREFWGNENATLLISQKTHSIITVYKPEFKAVIQKEDKDSDVSADAIDEAKDIFAEAITRSNLKNKKEIWGKLSDTLLELSNHYAKIADSYHRASVTLRPDQVNDRLDEVADQRKILQETIEHSQELESVLDNLDRFENQLLHKIDSFS